MAGIEEYKAGKVTPIFNEKGEPDIDIEKAKSATSAIVAEAGKEAREETGAELSEMEKVEQVEKPKRESSKAIFEGFTNDVSIVRKMMADYLSYDDERLREVLGLQITNEYENIKKNIEEQINATSDLHEKSDLDNMLFDLKNIVKKVEDAPQRKVVNG